MDSETSQSQIQQTKTETDEDSQTASKGRVMSKLSSKNSNKKQSSTTRKLELEKRFSRDFKRKYPKGIPIVTEDSIKQQLIDEGLSDEEAQKISSEKAIDSEIRFFLARLVEGAELISSFEGPTPQTKRTSWEDQIIRQFAALDNKKKDLIEHLESVIQEFEDLGQNLDRASQKFSPVFHFYEAGPALESIENSVAKLQAIRSTLTSDTTAIPTDQWQKFADYEVIYYSNRDKSKRRRPDHPALESLVNCLKSRKLTQTEAWKRIEEINNSLDPPPLESLSGDSKETFDKYWKRAE